MSSDKIMNDLQSAFATGKADATYPIIIAIDIGAVSEQTGMGVDALKNRAIVEAYVKKQGLRFVPHNLDYSGLVVCVKGANRKVIEGLASMSVVQFIKLNA